MTILRIERAEKKIEKIDDFEILKQNNDIKYNTICRFCKNEIYLIKQKYAFCQNSYKEYIFNNYLNLLQKSHNPIKYLFRSFSLFSKKIFVFL